MHHARNLFFLLAIFFFCWLMDGAVCLVDRGGGGSRWEMPTVVEARAFCFFLFLVCKEVTRGLRLYLGVCGGGEGEHGTWGNPVSVVQGIAAVISRFTMLYVALRLWGAPRAFFTLACCHAWDFELILAQSPDSFFRGPCQWFLGVYNVGLSFYPFCKIWAFLLYLAALRRMEGCKVKGRQYLEVKHGRISGI